MSNGAKSINEKCAVIAVSNKKDFDVSRLVYLGLWSMQHRGQDSSGIASYDGFKLNFHRNSGLVNQVYNEESLAKLKGKVSIGHNRYSTSGGDDKIHNQPYVSNDLKFAFAHNGNLPYTDKLKKYAEKNHLFYEGLNDTGLMALVISNELRKSDSIKKAISTCWPLFTGAFCCVGLYKDQIFAFRDSFGIRPLALGETDHGYVVASETAALDAVQAKFVRSVQPGELITMKDHNLESTIIANGKEQIDAFEFVYLARPDSKLGRQSVYETRHTAGRLLAKTAPVKADVVIGVPDSGLPAAFGYANGSSIPVELGLLKNRYIGRTFIEPEKIRRSSVQLKFNVIDENVTGKNIVLIDDSLVRGNTLKYVIKLLRDHGAKSIHVRLASPPVKFPDFYGIDTPQGNDLIASQYNQKQIQQLINADSLEFLTIEDFITSTGLSKSELCLSSFNGEYPLPVPYEASALES